MSIHLTPQLLNSPKETQAQAAILAKQSKPGRIIALTGDLGAGKTNFTQGFAKGLGYKGDVTSPTFVLVQEYTGGTLPLFHFDFYRLDHVEELIALGWDDYLDRDGVILAEWADRFPEAFPPGTEWWNLSHDGDNRRILTKVEQ